MPTPHTSLIVCATQRSGSTFFSDALTSTQRTGTPWEWLQKTDLADCRRSYGLPADVPYAELVEAIVQNQASADGVFALKLMWDTFRHFCHNMKQTAGFADLPEAELLRRFFPNPRFILVRRRNKLKQAISFVKACQSGVWMNREGQKTYFDENRLHFNYLEIQRARSWLEKQENAWSDFLTTNRIPFFEVYYEDFVQAYESTVNQALEFVGLAATDTLSVPPSKMRKMANSVNSQWLSHFQELDDQIGEKQQHNTLCPIPESERLAGISPVKDSYQLEAGQSHWIEMRVVNAGNAVWPAVGARDGRLWIVLKARFDKHEPVNPHPNTADYRGGDAVGYLPGDLVPGAEVIVPLHITAPRTAGKYKVQCQLCQESVGEFRLTGNSLASFDIEIIQHPKLIQSHQHFGEADVYFDDGCKYLGWFGYFYDANFPWISHEHHGLLYCGGPGIKSGEYWFWDKEMDGWWHTTSTTYPRLYSQTHAAFLQYSVGSVTPRQFCNTTTGEVVEATPNRA